MDYAIWVRSEAFPSQSVGCRSWIMLSGLGPGGCRRLDFAIWVSSDLWHPPQCQSTGCRSWIMLSRLGLGGCRRLDYAIWVRSGLWHPLQCQSPGCRRSLGLDYAIWVRLGGVIKPVASCQSQRLGAAGCRRMPQVGLGYLGWFDWVRSTPNPTPAAPSCGTQS